MKDSSKKEQGQQVKQREKQEQTGKTGRSIWRRILSVAVTAVVVLGALTLIVFRDRLNVDALRRAVSYMSVQKDEAGQAQEFTYEGDSSNCCVSFRDGVLIASSTQMEVKNRSGTQTFLKNTSMEHPKAIASKNVAVVYDVGGSTLYAVNGEKVLLEVTTEPDLAILSASLNDSGWLAVTAQESGSKGVVTVYNSAMEKVYNWYSSSRFVIDAYVLPGCKSMAAVTIGQNESQFESKVVIFRLDSEDEYASYSILDGLVLAMGDVDSKICTVTESGLVFSEENGEQAASYDFSGRFLREFDFSGDGFIALVLNKYKAGSQAKLITVNTKGETIASLETSDEILALSSAGKYVAVLYTDQLMIYSKDLQQYAELTGTGNARSVIMREDGTAMLIGKESARLYIP